MSFRKSKRRGNRQPRKKTSSNGGLSPMLRATKSLSTPYVFRFAQSGDITSNGSGILSSAIVCDPSSSGQNFSEWSSLITLFTQFRVLAFRVQFCLTGDQKDTGLSGAPVAIAGSFSSLSAPGSYDTVIENADSKFWQASNDKTRFGYTHTLKFPRKIDYTNVGTPVPGDFAGAPGAITLYASGWPNTTNCISTLIEGFYEFKSRT